MGYTAFANERPKFVKDVTSYSCVCSRCQGMVLLFKGLFSFPHWEVVCPPVHVELVQDVLNQSTPFSPSLDTLMDVVLCSRNESTGFFQKKCCYGECKACGLSKIGQDEV